MSPPKFPRTKHWIDSPQVHQDDSYHLDPEVFVDQDVVVLEKLDGGNICLCDGEVYARATSLPTHAGWFAMVRKHHAHKTVGWGEDLSVYGEDLFGIHSIEYDPIRESETFRVFGVLQKHHQHDRLLGSTPQGQRWYSWDELVGFCHVWDFPTVPCLFRGRFKSVKEISAWMHARIKQPSELGPTTEGFVIRCASGFSAEEYALKTAKYVRKGHVQTNQHWTINWKPCKLKR